MTETSSRLATHPLTNPTPVTAFSTSATPLLNGSRSPANEPEEEEYTIKCICIYTDDDGNTVYCEKCDTWQHIQCYYHGKKVPDVHYCADCDPRDIDAKKATERQRRARELLEGGDRKVKRPTSKGQKKKHRDTINAEQPNGWTNHDRHESIGNGRDQPPPAKKPKTGHRASGSVASVNGESRKRAHSNVQSYPSPSKSPQELYRYPAIPQYTSDFLDLYERDEGDTHAKSNEHTLSALRLVSAWKSNSSMVVDGKDAPPSEKTPFIRVEGDLETSSWPEVSIETTSNPKHEIDGKIPMWRTLRLQNDVNKDGLVGEIRGQVGTLDEYCHQQVCQNRWKDLAHPDPFVFFHPHMNIYIDSRRSGTKFRYIRRSCDPNVTLRTFITADDEVHHCFVANKHIPAGSELTAIWYLNPTLFDVNSGREETEQLHHDRCDFISRVLANFGDCACDHAKCMLDKFDRRSSLKGSDGPVKSGVGRKKKSKSKHAISPLSTGQATNSRAGSEPVKGLDEDDDQRSTSASSRSGPRSRDGTPLQTSLLDADPVLGNGLTAREMRKIQALEKATKEQYAKGEKKGKKRSSGGSNMNTPNVGSSKQLGSASTPTDMKRFSGSPPPMRPLKDVSNRPTPRSSQSARASYTSTSVQTDPEDCGIDIPPAKRRKYSTPTQRLLKKLLGDRTASRHCSRTTSPESLRRPSSSHDVEMRDASSSMSPTLLAASAFTLPSQAAHILKVHGGFKSPAAPKLSLSTLPPVPIFTSASANTPGSNASTPIVSTPTVAQSPGALGLNSMSYLSGVAGVVTPSPAKKKLSLGDYMSRRKESATPVLEKSQLQAALDAENGNAAMEQLKPDGRTDSQSSLTKPSDTIMKDAATNSAANEEAIDDTPTKAEIEPERAVSEIPPSSEQTDSHGDNNASTDDTSSQAVAPEVANVLASLQQMRAKQEAGTT